MKTSIRLRLIFTLVALFTVSWLSLTIFTYFESRHEIEELFDSELAQSAAVLSEMAFYVERHDGRDIHQKLEREVYGHPYEKKIAFQVWSGDTLKLSSASAPAVPMTDKVGYSDKKLDEQYWRMFLLPLQDNQKIIVAERYDVREELIYEITFSSLYPLLLALPLLSFLIWVGIKQSLQPLNRIAGEVEKRSPRQLEPISSRGDVPDEIRPLVSSLNQLLEQLKDAFERERQFTSDAAHELRTPLASVKVQAQVAMRSKDKEETRTALNQLVSGIDRTTHLVEQLLTLARVEPGSQNLEMHTIQLNKLAEMVVAELVTVAEQKHITLDASLDNACPVTGNEIILSILIRNLVDNAIRYTQEEGRIKVQVSRQDNKIKLLVEDNGPGISEEMQQQVFKRFYRGQDNSYISGCGLGLSIVQRIAEIHGADISLSRPAQGNGLVVEVSFPC